MAYKDKEQMMKYNNEYNRQNYDRVTVMFPKGTRKELEEIAGPRGVGEYIRAAVQMRMNTEKEGRQ